MAVTISALTCPQCGSADLAQQDGFWVCRTCGSKVVVEHDSELLSSERSQTEGGEYVKVAPAFTGRDFVAAVYRQLAQDDAPLDVFELAEFENPSLTYKQIIVECQEAQLDYSAGVGYDRQEPYLTTETYYDKNLGCKRERYVTKYKTVTDWSTTSGMVSAKSTAVTENAATSAVRESDFANAYTEAPEESFSDLSDEDREQIVLAPEALQRLEEEHDNDFYGTVKQALPGDRNRDIRYNAEVTHCSTDVVLSPTFSLTFRYAGKAYTRSAFAFGKELRITGDAVHGASGEKDGSVWAQTKIWTILAAVLLAVSAVLSFVIPSILAIVLIFAGAAGVFVANEVIVHKKTATVNKDYADRKQKALEEKLASLPEEMEVTKE